MGTSTARMARMRARRAAERAELAPSIDRDPDDLLLPAVRETVAALGLDGAGAAAAQVALRYAAVIDSRTNQAYALRDLGPLLLQTLQQLGATPMARQ